MLSIFKYRIGQGEEVEAPVIHWLHCDYQKRENSFVAWALVDLEAEDRVFKFRLAETGVHFHSTQLEGYQYLGSVNLDIYVAHFFVAELDPETREVLREEKNDKKNDIKINDYNKFNEEINKDFNFTWSPDHLKWLDPNSLEIDDNKNWEITCDWTYRPEMEVTF